MLIKHERARCISLLIAFIAAYVLTGMVGLFIQSGHDGITPIWPPSGIALYAFILQGPRIWPLVPISITILGVMYNIPVLAFLVAALGNTCEALIGWYLYKRFNIELGHRLGDTWRFLVLPVLLAPLAGASFGSLGMVAGGATDLQALPFMWFTWWLGDACGILLFTPLLIAWARQPAWFRSTPRLLEWLLVTGVSVFLGWYTFVYEQQQPPGETINIMFLVTPFLIWASIRLGLRGATLVSLIACCWVLWGAAHQTGPFALADARMTGIIESSFIFVITLTALIVQAMFREHTSDIDRIRQANEALAERVGQRTAALEQANDDLVAAKESAELANASKTRFLVAASHDLRQPLQAIATHADILGIRSSQPEIAGNIDQLKTSCQAMGRILDKLTDIGKLESGEIDMDIHVFRIDGLLDELRQQHTQTAEAKGLTLGISGCDRSIRSDYTLLRLILQNLIGNAIKYTDTGGVNVDCLAQGDLLHISVTDTGIGIDEAKQEIIFEDFYQLDNPARDRDKGMGVGLAIVRRMANLLDHPLQLTSAPGEGSTFTIEVPIAADAPARHGSREIPGSASAETSEAILLIDDDLTVLHSQEMLLHALGYRVYSAKDADSALQHGDRASQPCDLIITDYRLPHGITGSQLVSQLREQTGRQTPAIILTGDITLAELDEGPGNCLLLRKPVSTGELELAIRQQLDSQSARG
jgi:signal transduction histidine kinase/ActR/RegA family two-component response regulator